MAWGDARECAAALGPIASPAERERAAAFRRPADAARSLAGAALLRIAAGALLGLPPEQVRVARRCPACGGAHGRPDLGPGRWGSISHAGDVACAAVSAAGPIGIDIEPLGRRVDPLVLAGILTPGDPAAAAGGGPSDTAAGGGPSGTFAGGYASRAAAGGGPSDAAAGGGPLVVWTRKEAVLKATGEGLATPMGAVWVSPADRPARFIRHTGRPGLRCALADLTAIVGFVGCIAEIAEPGAGAPH